MLSKEDKIDKKQKRTNDTNKQSRSLYKRFASSIIPPLSLLSLDCTSPSKESRLSDGDFNKDEKVLSDDEDIAHPVGGLAPLNNFVNMLYAGMGRLDDLKRSDANDTCDANDTSDANDMKFDDRLAQTSGNEPKSKAKNRRKYKIDYDIDKSDDGDVESIDDENDALQPEYKEDNSHHAGSDAETHRENVHDLFLDDHDEQTTALASDPSKRTRFQQSVLKNLDPFRFQQTELMKLRNVHTPTSEDESEEDKLKKNRFRLKVADKLKRVFELNDDDYFYGNYNVWLVKDVLLQGHIYLTKESILFFTFLPKRYNAISATNEICGGFQHHDDSHDVIQAGALGMKTAQYGDTFFSTPLTHRFWAILRNETITVYNSPTDLYFPITLIDLKSCVSAEVIDRGKVENNVLSRPDLSNNDSQDVFAGDEESDLTNMLNFNYPLDENPENVSGGFWFKVVTKKKTHKFYSDSLYSARQWVNNITKVVFKLHNSNANNEVIMKIPINNVLSYDISESFGVSERNTDINDENPKVLNINHLDDSKVKLATRMKREFKKKTKKKVTKNSENEEDDVPSEETYFLLFKNGKEVYRTLNDIVNKAHQIPKIFRENDKSDNIFKKYKGETRNIWGNKLDDRTDDDQLPRAISTLTTDHFPNSIIDQVVEANHRSPNTASQYLNSPRSEYSSTNSTPSLPQSKMKKFGRTLTTPSRIFSSKSKSESTSEKSTPDRSETSSPVQGINLPKQLSLSGLKNLNMAFEASEKSYEVYDTRYTHTDDNNNNPSNSQSYFQSNTRSKADALSPQIMSPKSIEAGSLNLTDPSEYEDNKKKHNKLSSIGKSIKAMSSLTNKLGAVSHYEQISEEDTYFIRDIMSREVAVKHFQERFSFSIKKKLVASYQCHLLRSVPVFGKMYLGDTEICFRSLLPGVSTKMILPLIDVDTCQKEKGSNIGYSGLVIVIRGYDELFMEFSVQRARDDCVAMIMRQLEKNRDIGASPLDDVTNEKVSEFEHAEYKPSNIDMCQSATSIKLAQSRIENARLKLFEDKINAAAGLHVPIILEDSPFFKTEIRPSTSFNFTLLTIGSRGDVQPYIALAKGLLAEGHNVTIATHSEFEEWIIGHGIHFKKIAGNPVELMSLMVKHGSMSVSFLKEASTKFRGWIQELLDTSWKACQGSDILIESPSAMVGAHIAESLGIPYMRAFTMPWTRTRAYPHAFIVPDKKKGGSYNYLTHVMFETIFWKGISGQVNKWRIEQLGLPRTNLYKLSQYDIPFLYNISPTIFPPSVDFPDWVKVTGYWFLDEGSAEEFTPPKKLVDFMDKARADGKKIVYIGFGSIVVNNARSLTNAITEAVLKADVRCILNKGWSDKNSKPEDNTKEPEIELPKEIYNSGSIPHDWLFPIIDAAVHHGGSGTTGATMRAGIPTIIKPFFGDQFFYSSRLEGIGAGIGIKKLNSRSLCNALKTATSDMKMIEKAKKIGERLKQENGVLNAIEAIYYQLEYARSLILAKQHENAQHNIRSGSQTPVVNESEEYNEDIDYATDNDLKLDQTHLFQNDDNRTEFYESSLGDNTTVKVDHDSVTDVTTNNNTEILPANAA